MTAVRIAAYLRAAAAVAWRAIIGRPCACEFCRAHQDFIRESDDAYQAEVHALVVHREYDGAA